MEAKLLMDEILIAQHSHLDEILIACHSLDTEQLEAFNVHKSAMRYEIV